MFSGWSQSTDTVDTSMFSGWNQRQHFQVDRHQTWLTPGMFCRWKHRAQLLVVNMAYFADGDRGNKAKKGKAKAKPKGKVKNSKQNSDDEAIEESDEGDYDDREVDYISDSSR